MGRRGPENTEWEWMGEGQGCIPSVLERTPCLDGLQSTQKNSRRLSRNEMGAARCGQVSLQVWELSPCCSLCTMGVEVG